MGLQSSAGAEISWGVLCSVWIQDWTRHQSCRLVTLECMHHHVTLHSDSYPQFLVLLFCLFILVEYAPLKSGFTEW